jgi:hypothetical protein
MTKYRQSQLFIGRERELKRLAELSETPGAKILVVYGRRRIGKTTLIRKAFTERGLLTFEGLEGKTQTEQLEHFAAQLALNFSDSKLAKLRFANWTEALITLSDFIKDGLFTIHFEEIQWMAGYRDDLISELKYVWDNLFSKNTKLILILCGSSPSFLINSVMRSRALHNRSQYEFPIGELPFSEARQLMGGNRSQFELLDGYLTVGGVPEYCNKLASSSSVYLALAEQSFTKGVFFTHEAERVFVSSLAHKPEYRDVIEYIAKNGPHTKIDIIRAMRSQPGGSASSIFSDLQECEFIYSYSPLEFGKESRGSKWLVRDCYLHFFYKLIQPKLAAIKRGDFDLKPTEAISQAAYRQWIGFAFERFCLLHHKAIASALGFSGVQYEFGPYYLRTDSQRAQIDLVFKRADKVLTVCEIKYLRAPPGREVVVPFERNLRLLDTFKPYTIQKVLISPNGVDDRLAREHYFDRVIDLEELLGGVG